MSSMGRLEHAGQQSRFEIVDGRLDEHEVLADRRGRERLADQHAGDVAVMGRIGGAGANTGHAQPHRRGRHDAAAGRRAGWSAPSMTSPNCSPRHAKSSRKPGNASPVSPPELRGRSALLAWLDRLRTKGFWLVDDDVFGCNEHVCALSVMGARRDGVDTQTRVVIVFRYRDGRQV